MTDTTKTIITTGTLTSQSTFTTLKTRTRAVVLDSERVEVSPDFIRGKKFHTLEVEIPSWFPTDKELESSTEMIAALGGVESKLLLAVLQSGIAQELIQVWTKPKPRAGSKTTMAEDIWSAGYVELALERTRAYKPEPLKRPSAGNGKAVETARYQDCIKAVANMLAAKLDNATIHMALDTVYTAEIVDGCIEALANQS